jgi:hypothetical protein
MRGGGRCPYPLATDHLGPSLTFAINLRKITVGNLSPAMRARSREGIGLSYWPASLCSLATQFQTWFLESIPRPMARLKFPTQVPRVPGTVS